MDSCYHCCAGVHRCVYLRLCMRPRRITHQLCNCFDFCESTHRLLGIVRYLGVEGRADVDEAHIRSPLSRAQQEAAGREAEQRREDGRRRPPTRIPVNCQLSRTAILYATYILIIVKFPFAHHMGGARIHCFLHITVSVSPVCRSLA